MFDCLRIYSNILDRNRSVWTTPLGTYFYFLKQIINGHVFLLKYKFNRLYLKLELEIRIHVRPNLDIGNLNLPNLGIGNFNLPNLGIGITLKPMMLDHVELADEASNTYPRTIQPIANP